MKYYKIWVTLACVGLIISSFLPLTYYPDIKETFTGFYTRDNLLGKPGYVFCFFSIISLIIIFINNPIAKYAGIGVAAVNLAFVIKTFTSFTVCYLGTCPQKLLGIYLLLLFAILLLVGTLFPDLKLMSDQSKNSE